MNLCQHYWDFMSNYHIEESCIVDDTIRENSIHESFSDSRIGVYPHPADRSVPFHTHEYYELIYIHRGHCINLVDRKEIPLGEGDLCLMNPRAYHTLHCPQPEQTVIFNILIGQAVLESSNFQMLSYNDFVSNFFLNSFEKEHQQENYIVFSAKHGSEPFVPLCRQLIEEYYESERAPYQKYKLNSLFNCLLIELIRCYQQTHNVSIGKKTPQYKISDVIQYMADHCEDVTLQSLSAHFSYHPKHFSRVIRQATGQSFSDLLLTIRLQRAKVLIETTRLPITEIMRRVGYQNYTWFTSQFQKQFQRVPSGFRTP